MSVSHFVNRWARLCATLRYDRGPERSPCGASAHSTHMNVTDRDRGSSNLAPARTPPFVSVIVPVFNQSEPLRACLRALNGQTSPRARFEVIVVDNGSTDPVSVPTGSHSTVRVEGESKPGSYAARNRGVAIARGSVIAFTDADCVPAADWV